MKKQSIKAMILIGCLKKVRALKVYRKVLVTKSVLPWGCEISRFWTSFKEEYCGFRLIAN